MHLPRSEQLAAELMWLDETTSTNEILRQLVVDNPSQPNRTVLVTDTQTAGRGRLGREWLAPPGTGLAFCRPPAAPSRFLSRNLAEVNGPRRAETGAGA